MARILVKIVNKHDKEYSETLNTGEVIIIPADGYITMGRSEAVKFLGKHPGMDNRTGKAVVKKLFIEPITASDTLKAEVKAPVLEPGTVTCPFGCGFVAKNKQGLSVHLRTCKA